MPANSQSTPDKQEVENKNRLIQSKESNGETFGMEAIKCRGEPFRLLRLQKNPAKLDICEECPFFENIGRGIDDFVSEVRAEQEELYPVLKNEYLFLKEVIEAKVKYAKVA